MATLLLVRHGETDWTADGRLQGHTDRPLNDHGRHQAAELAERLAREGAVAVYASDLAGAKETAEIVAARLRLPVVTDPDLRERNWGSWEGLTPAERDRIVFEGEPPEAHRARVVGAIERIAERHPGQHVIVVTHGGSMRRVQAAVTGIAQPVVANCESWACVHENGVFRAID